MFHISLDYHAKFFKKYISVMLVHVQNWGKMTYLPQQQCPLLEISYILLFSVMTLHYQRLYKISSLEAEV